MDFAQKCCLDDILALDCFGIVLQFYSDINNSWCVPQSVPVLVLKEDRAPPSSASDYLIYLISVLAIQ